MKPIAHLFVWTFISLSTLTMGCAEMKGGSTAGGKSTTPSATSANTTAVTTGPNRVSQGTQGDSLEACMDRIPSDATSGQRMLAERTCQRDANTRNPIFAVPGQ